MDDGSADETRAVIDTVLLRVVDEPWPFPPNYPLAPQQLAALELLDSSPVAATSTALSRARMNRDRCSFGVFMR